MDALRRLPLGLNIATLIGHCAVRQYALGDDSVERPASEDEIRQMEQLVRDGMDAGAFGFSTNMNDRHFREDGKPIPSRLAEREEVDRLCAVVGDCQRGLVQFSHGGFRSACPGPMCRSWQDTDRRAARGAARPVPASIR